MAISRRSLVSHAFALGGVAAARRTVSLIADRVRADRLVADRAP